MTATPQPKPLAQRPVLWLAIVVGLLVATLAVVMGVTVGKASASDDAAGGSSVADGRPSPAAVEPGVTVAAPVEAPPVVPTSVIPSDCAAIYSTDWAAQLDGLVLNPAWSSSDDSAIFGTSDSDALSVLLATKRLNCQWGSENGGGSLGLVTTLAEVSAEQQATLIEGLSESGYDCFDERSGTRCTTEQSDDDGFTGESQFFREGVWLATRWVNIAPDGYTHDIIDTLWP